MKLIRLIVLGFVAALSSAAVWAAPYYQLDGYPNRFPSVTAACEYGTTIGYKGTFTVEPYTPGNQTLFYCVYSSGMRGVATKTTPPPDACEAKMGQAQSLEFKIGWAKYYNNPDGGTIPIDDGGSVTPIPPIKRPPFEICYQGCKAAGGTGDTIAQYADKTTLNNGHVQLVEHRKYSFTGQSCTEGEPNTDLSGENPGAGGDGGGDDGGGDDGGGDDDNPGGGSNNNDPKPPVTGGDPGDGPGGGSGGNNDSDTEPTCGVAGKPPCNTTIDETGTPVGPGDKMNRDNINTQYDKLSDALNKVWSRSDKDTSWTVPGWFGSGSCTPWNFGAIKGQAFVIDYCPAVPLAKGATTFAWVVVTFFAVLAMVARSIGGK